MADVRRYPASRRNPQFARETLAEFLEARGIGYRWFPELGGRRSGAARAASPNLGLTSPGFRQYADYAGTAEFRAALEEFLEWAREAPTALLCAEALGAAGRGPCEEASTAEELVRFAEVFAALPLRDQRLVRARLEEERSFPELAGLLEYSSAFAARRAFRAAQARLVAELRRA